MLKTKKKTKIKKTKPIAKQTVFISADKARNEITIVKKKAQIVDSADKVKNKPSLYCGYSFDGYTTSSYSRDGIVTKGVLDGFFAYSETNDSGKFYFVLVNKSTREFFNKLNDLNDAQRDPDNYEWEEVTLKSFEMYTLYLYTNRNYTLTQSSRLRGIQ